MSAILLHGDCIQLMRDMSDHSVDCFICDLPYGCLNNKDPAKVKDEWWYSAGQHRGCTWDVKLNLEEFWTEVKRLCRNDHTPVLMFCNTKFGYELIHSNPSWFRYDLVWNKQRGVSFLSANKMPLKSHEMIYVFSKKGAYYKRIDMDDKTRIKSDPQYNKPIEKTRRSGNVYATKESKLTRAKGCPPGKRCPLSVIDFTKVGTFKHTHPTEKPKDLYRWLLERYCPAGGTVLDPTAGSFNAILVAREMGLHGIGMEKDKGFFDTAVKKFNNQPEPEPEPAPPTNEIISP